MLSHYNQGGTNRSEYIYLFFSVRAIGNETKNISYPRPGCKSVSYLDMNACCRPVVLSQLLDTFSRHFEAAAACSSVNALVFLIHRAWYRLTIRPN